MDIAARRKIVAILKVLHERGAPAGSSAISEQLLQWGIDLGERMIRNYLDMTDQAGMTKNLGRRGRTITDLGRKELEIGIVIDNVGFVAARVDEMTYRMKFDLDAWSGSVITNTSFIRTQHTQQTLFEIRRVINAGLGMGKYLTITYPGQSIQDRMVPANHIAVSTICSVTLNGVLLSRGVVTISRFGGLLELSDRQPVRFTHSINYDGSTLDPLVIFIKGKMTSVRQAAMTGTGTIGASFREIPSAALPAAKQVIDKLERLGLGGVLMLGKPNQPLLDIPVSHGRVGLIVAGGLNPVAALEETGIETSSQALHCLCEFNQLKPIEQYLA
jgi:HTH-type transcriptional regulator, global nitrogen regulator NrpRI